MNAPETTVIEESKHQLGKLRVFQDRYANGAKFATCEFHIGKNAAKKHPALPMFISITDNHFASAKDAMLKYLEKFIAKKDTP